MLNDIHDQYSSSTLNFSKCLIKLYGGGMNITNLHFVTTHLKGSFYLIS